MTLQKCGTCYNSRKTPCLSNDNYPKGQIGRIISPVCRPKTGRLVEVFSRLVEGFFGFPIFDQTGTNTDDFGRHDLLKQTFRVPKGRSTIAPEIYRGVIQCVKVRVPAGRLFLRVANFSAVPAGPWHWFYRFPAMNRWAIDILSLRDNAEPNLEPETGRELKAAWRDGRVEIAVEVGAWDRSEKIWRRYVTDRVSFVVDVKNVRYPD